VRLLSVIHGPAFGGAHNQALVLSGPLRERGIDTWVVLPEEAREAAARLEAGGVHVSLLPLGRLRATPDPFAQGRFARRLRGDLRRLEQAIEETEADVVQVHGPTNPQGAIAAKRAGRPVVWQLLDTRAPMPLRRLTMPYVLRTAGAVTAWGEELARAHPGATRLGDRLTVIFPPVDVAGLQADEAIRAKARRTLEVAPDEVLIVSLGVVNPQKGHDSLIRAAGRIAREGAQVALRILGTHSQAHGKYKLALTRTAEEAGFGADIIVDPGTHALDLLQAADIFALASVARSEGMPTVILEAMALEKPVVATRVGAVPELVEEGVSAVLVDPGDDAGLADRLSALVGDDSRRTLMGAAGRLRAESEFSLDRLADLHARAIATARSGAGS
jgi:glycosyltransferase involved in cell wall biosynthesis